MPSPRWSSIRCSFTPLALLALLGAGCATTTSSLEPVEPPDGAFHELTCEQLQARHRLTTEQMHAIGQPIDQRAMGDRLAMGAGVVFWPALYMVQGKQPDHASYARLKGEAQRLAALQTLRDCPPVLTGPSERVFEAARPSTDERLAQTPRTVLKN